MNRQKLTVEQFRLFKNKLVDLIRQAEDFYDTNKDYMALMTKFMDNTKKQYIKIQTELLSYDLSLVPFDEWDGLEIMGVADLSKTSANVDFAILSYHGLGNFHGCNVKNLKYIKRWINDRDFDEITIRNNPDLFLSEQFDSIFKQKYYNHSLKVSDIMKLSTEQWDELVKKEIMEYLHGDYWELKVLEILGFEKTKTIYNDSYECFKLVVQTLEYSLTQVGNVRGFAQTSFSEHLKTIKLDNLQEFCFEYIKNSLFVATYSKVNIKTLPTLFVKYNKNLLLIDEKIPDELQTKYYERNLKLQEVIDNIHFFEGIDIEFFIGEKSYDILNFAKTLGQGNFLKLLKKYPDEIKYFIEKNEVDNFIKYYHRKIDLDDSFIETLKEYIVNEQYPKEFEKMDFVFIDDIKTLNELMNYNNKTIIRNESQRSLINLLGIDNIKQFENETGFFSYKEETTNELVMLHAMTMFFLANRDSREKLELVLRNMTLQYDDFKEVLATYLDEMRRNNIFANYPDYDWMTGDFRDKHPSLFMDVKAPLTLKTAFYNNLITPSFLFEHKEFIPYLIDKDLTNTINANIMLNLPSLVSKAGFTLPMSANFIQEYVKRYGTEKTLQLIAKYGDAFDDLKITCVHGEVDNEEQFEKKIRLAIYNKIIEQGYGYEHLSKVPEFSNEYPELVINLDSLSTISLEKKQILEKIFYYGRLEFNDIKEYPELKIALKDKNLHVAFSKDVMNKYMNFSNKSFQEKLLNVLGNEKFLDLCIRYGNYLKYINDYNFFDNIDNEINFTKLKLLIEQNIAKLCKNADIPYSESAAEFLKKDYPELFIDEKVPEELKKYFYGYDNYLLSFEVLKRHKEWLPYLKNKLVSIAILKAVGHSSQRKLLWKKYFETFGDEKGIRLGINRTETVTQMVEANQIELMKQWYDKTGGKFIPDFVVMQNFKLEEIDKFLISGNNWSSLMRIEKYAHHVETRDSMLKLAYTFGAFDQDKRGFNQLYELLVGVPKKIDAEYGYIIERIDNDITSHSKRNVFFKKRAIRNTDGTIRYEPLITDKNERELAYQQMLEYVKSSHFNFLVDTNILVSLLETIKYEFDDFDFSQNIFSQLYRSNEDGSYTLIINQQLYPKTAQVMRNILERFRELPLLTPDKAHQICSGFELRYDPDFREFFLNNLSEIVNNYEYTTYLSSIQKQFQKIKVANSNRTLTLDLATSYVQNNKYENVNLGNEKLARISAIAGYNQQDFEKLQQIYNYGKQRTFSSIPRIENFTGKYTYEMLRLDDPLALSIGTLTDCCQELGNVAEMCMQHSMVDKNGRIFVIRDQEGNIISQSWVWRNKNVLCFDNIEIPDKVLSRISRNEKDDERKKFTDEIYEIYEKAANDLIMTDEKKYHELFEQGKIKKEQYEQLRLSKITVGLGYNDIAESLKRKAVFDDSDLARPLPFFPPVSLSRGLYTADSSTQYIIAKRDNQIDNITEDTIHIYNDNYIEYDDSNFNEKLLLMLQKLELVTNNNDIENISLQDINNEYIVTKIARNYRLNPENTKIIMNTNMAIIYEVLDKKIKIGSLLFNTKVDNQDQQLDIELAVKLQIWLALEQIKGDKDIDISLLNDKQKEMYNKVINLEQELYLESGVGYGRK